MVDLMHCGDLNRTFKDSFTKMRFLAALHLVCCVILWVQCDSFVIEDKSLRQSQNCGDAVNGIHAFTIPCNSSRGPITLMHIQYDASRAVPVTSTTYHDSMNKEQNVPREDNFRPWPCPQLPSPSVQPACSNSFRMTSTQQALSGYTSYDRGHMSPVNPYRFDFTAQDATFYCVNNAPQEPRTNQVYWSAIEDAIYQRPEAGLVITGLCTDENPDGVTEAGYTVPGCYFKMFCYKTGSSAAVIGYIGENSLYDRTNTTADQIRGEQTRTVRSQADILKRFGGSATIIENAWLEAEQVLLNNREGQLAPTARACINAKTVSASVKEEWSLATEESQSRVFQRLADQNEMF